MTSNPNKPKAKLAASDKVVPSPPDKATIAGKKKPLKLPDRPKKAREKQSSMPKAAESPMPNEAKAQGNVAAGKLSKILAPDGQSELQRAWDTTPAADEFVPLPAGEYIAWLAKGELIKSKSRETPGYEMEFRIVEGDYCGRRCWYRVWLTIAAAAMTKRELSKIRITSLQQLDRPVPQRLICSVTLALRVNDAGVQYNEVRAFTVLRTESPLDDPYAPTDLLNYDADHSEGGGT